MATHSNVLACRIPGMGEPGRLPSMGSHRVGQDRSDLAAAATATVTNRVKGLDPIDRVPEELWMEVPDIVQKVGIKIIPKKKKHKKAKWLSEEALQIPEKRRETKGKGEKERYIHLNAEFQRIARRDKSLPQ